MTSRIGTVYVGDEGPGDSKIAFVGEAPGVDEEYEHRPFIGEAGNVLERCLGRNGIQRASIDLRNLAHFRPERNKFELLLGTTELAKGIEELRESILAQKPNVIAALGNWPLYFLTEKHGKSPGSGITLWRGSILECTMKELEGIKVIPTYHPAYVSRDRSKYPIFDQDIKRIISDSTFPELRLPQRKLVIGPKGDELEYWVGELLKADRLSCDIENYGTELACVGFAPSPDIGVSIDYDGSPHVVESITRLLSSNIPITFHFGTHDTTILEFFYGYQVKNYGWDTLIAQHIMWPELPRSLAYLTSIYTREPYYKHERKEDAASIDTKSWSRKVKRERLLAYNCKDVCTTAEVQIAQEQEMKEGPKNWRRFFTHEMECLETAHEISRSGMLIDKDRNTLLKGVMAYQWADYQAALNKLVGAEFNVGSPKQVQALLYDELKLPEKTKRDSEGGKKRTADEDAIVSLINFARTRLDEVVRESTKSEWRRKLAILKGILVIRGIRKLISSYIAPPGGIASPDGRFRSMYKVGGTDTGRWSAETFIDKSGGPGQTLPREPEEIDEKAFERVLELIESGGLDD